MEIEIEIPPELLTNNTIILSFYQTKLTFSESYCQILQTFLRETVPGITSFSFRYQLNLYWLGYVQIVPSEQCFLSIS